MSKSKPSTKPAKRDATEGVKSGRVTKPGADSGKSHKSVKLMEKVKEAIKPKIDDETDDESDISDSVASDDEDLEEKVTAKGKVKAGAKKIEATDDSDESAEDTNEEEVDSEEDSEDSDDSEEDSEDDSEDEVEEKTKEIAKAAPAANGAHVNGDSAKDKKKVNGAVPAAEDTSDSSDSSEDDEEDDAESDAGKDASDSEDDSDSSSEADSEDDSEEEDNKKSTPASKVEDDVKAAAKGAGNKRKAFEEEATPAKKTKIESGQGSSLFIGNLSWNVDKDWIYSEFEEFGSITGCRIITEKETGRSKGYGYIDFSTPEEAAAAQEARHGYLLDNRELRVDFATPRPDRPQDSPASFRDRANSRAKSFGDVTSAPTKTLWVGNLPYGTDEGMLKEEFGRHGPIVRIGLPRDRETGEIKGIGYVTYREIEQAKEALEALNGTDFGGRSLRIDFDKGRDDDNGGFRGGFSGGRGRGGDRGGRGRGGDRGGRGGFGDRGGRGGGFNGGFRGGRGGGRGRGGPPNTTNRGGFGDFAGQKVSFD